MNDYIIESNSNITIQLMYGKYSKHPGYEDIVGPSGMRALHMASGRNEGGHYFRYFFHSSLLGAVVIQNTRRGCCRVSNFCIGP